MWMQEDTHCLIQSTSFWTVYKNFLDFPFLEIKGFYSWLFTFIVHWNNVFFWEMNKKRWFSLRVTDPKWFHILFLSLKEWAGRFWTLWWNNQRHHGRPVDKADYNNWALSLIGIFSEFFLISSFLLRLEKKRKHLKFQFLKFWLMDTEWLQLLVQVALRVHQKLWLPPWAAIKVTAACVA